MNLFRSTLSASLVSILACAGAFAGDVNPPFGPIAPTMKNLDTVEPRIPVKKETAPGDAGCLFRITKPGSYFLTENVQGVPGKNGIEIAASDVTLDLMGFTLQGVNGSQDGITRSAASIDNIRITNGLIRSWGGDGIDLSQGANHHVSSVQSVNNGHIGILCDENAIIESCSATGNGLEGISCAGFNAVLRNCNAYKNGAIGIQVVFHASITGCAAYDNGASGFVSGSSAVFSHCSSVQNAGDGISAGSGSTITFCASDFNSDDGIVSSNGSTISNCTATANTGDGIQVVSDCHVLNNTCDSNGNGGDGAGIHVLNNDNRIEANNVTDADRGIDVDGAGNLVVRNSASGNTSNYEIAANNSAFVIAAATSAAISGSSGGVPIGIIDPWANLSY